MPRVISILIAMAFGLLTLTSPASAQGDRDCYQFASWYDAQEVYEASMYNPGWDVFFLDEDGDGLACECLYYGYHCLTPWD